MSQMPEMEDRVIGGVTVMVAEKSDEIIIFGSVPAISEDKLLAMVQKTTGKSVRRVRLTAWPNPDPEVYGWSQGSKDYSSQSSHSSGGRYCAPWSSESD